VFVRREDTQKESRKETRAEDERGNKEGESREMEGRTDEWK
jgi:hypothetical protein